MIKETLGHALDLFAEKLGYTVNLEKIDFNDEIKLYEELFGGEAVREKTFYNIGAGSFFHPLWTNVDFYSNWYKDNMRNIGIHFDLMSLDVFPIKSNSGNIVYTSHTIEHITDAAADNLFKNVYRILKDDGVFRITCPNVDLFYRAYKEKDRYFYKGRLQRYSHKKEMERVNLLKPMKKASSAQLFLWHVACHTSKLHADGADERFSDEDLNKIFSEMDYEESLDYITSHCSIDLQKKYPGNHINWWNHKKVKRKLKKAGFSKIYDSFYGQSCLPPLRNTSYFDNTHPEFSLYVEAVK